MSSWKLYLDDIRSPKDPTFVISRNVEDAKKLVETCGMPTFISFDHDLGMDKKGNVLSSGYDFAKWLVEMDMDGIYVFPENFSFNVHSMNPVGSKNIHDFMNGYLEYKEKERLRNGY